MPASEIPVILTAFGTTAKAFNTYEKMDGIIRTAFPENPVYWAYSSRMVKHAIRKKQKLNLKDPLEMAEILAAKGHPWVVFQSLHLICGHEFDRLVTERESVAIRSSMGLPLLTSHRDYERTARAMAGLLPEDPGEAAVIVGHGTDHPAWSVYPAFEAVMRKEFGNRIFVGVVEDFPDLDYTLDRVKAAGFKKIRLIPMMLVAGVHFKEDLTCEEDSWQKVFEQNGIAVSVVDTGIGHIEAVSQIFCDHISDALDVIPL